jgi:hypothetical protein
VAAFSPTQAEGPISSGSSAGARATRMLYATKMATRTTVSTRVMLTRSGRVNEYTVARSRNTNGTESVRDRVTRVA